jgi:hypothetical protein
LHGLCRGEIVVAKKGTRNNVEHLAVLSYMCWEQMWMCWGLELELGGFRSVEGPIFQNEG